MIQDQIKLANGATLIDASLWQWGSHSPQETIIQRVVLAEFQQGTFVTWIESAEVEPLEGFSTCQLGFRVKRDPSTHWGHYFHADLDHVHGTSAKEKAREDFFNRMKSLNGPYVYRP